MIAADPGTVRQRIAMSRQRHWRELVGGGSRPCCEKAVRAERGEQAHPCVCAFVETCPDHGVTHVGTHE